MPNPFFAEIDPIPYLKSPALSPDGQTIYFVHAGDIWSVGIGGGQARQVTSSVGDDSTPRVSPEGKRLAFVSTRTGNGDIYLLNLVSGDVTRLTYFDGLDALGGWSPNGEWLCFSSRREALSGCIYKIRASGGTPVALVEDARETHSQATFSPDGLTLAFVNDATAWWRRGPHPAGASGILTVSEAEGADDHRRLTSWKGRNVCPMWSPEGDALYYLSDEDGVENVWSVGLDGAPPSQLSSFNDGRCYRASIQPGGLSIVIDRDDGIWRFDPSAGKAEAIAIHVVGDQKVHPVTNRVFNGDLDELSLSPDGKKIVFAVHGELFAAPAQFEETYDAVRVTHTPFRESHIDWHPDSSAIVYLSDREGDNQIFRYDFAEREETRLTDTPGQKHLPIHSPDGKWIAYLHNQDEIRLIDTETDEDRPFIKDLFLSGVGAYSCFAWSPDSRWIVFLSVDESFFTNLFVQRIDEEAAHQITFLGQLASTNPLWSPDGRFILYNTQQYRTQSQIARVDLKPVSPDFKEDDFEKLFEEEDDEDKEPTEGDVGDPGDGAERDGTDEDDESDTVSEHEGPEEKPDPKEVEPVDIAFEGIKRRLRLLTPLELNASALAISPDSKHLVASVSFADRTNLYRMSLEQSKSDEPPRPLTGSKSRKGSVSFLRDGKSIVYLEDGVVTRRGFPDGKPKKLRTRCRFDVDFNLEKRQVFQEAWTLLRDHFYDPDFHGVNWPDLRNQLLPLVAGAKTKRDLTDLLNKMVGELNSSHLGAVGGGGPQRDGYLGIRFRREPLEANGSLQVSEVLPDGPAANAESAVEVGDFIEAVDDRDVRPDTDFRDTLRHTSGRKLRLRLRSPSGEVRESAVRPVDANEAARLAYRNWVLENEAYVSRVSGGRLGYVHIRAMGLEDLQQFLVDLDTETHGREGVLIDVRFNPGGHIATFILDVLAKRDTVTSSYRGRLTSSSAHVSGNRILGKPTILLTNEHSGSNAEMFSEGYRSLGLGKVVGTPTAGAVIWTTGWTLLDGTSFRVPFVRVGTREGENLELNSRPVDVHVERPLGESARGVDSQMDRAAQILLEQIDSLQP